MPYNHFFSFSSRNSRGLFFNINDLAIVDIDDCTEGHYLGLIKGKNNERYVLNSFRLDVETLIQNLKSVTNWNGSPIYISKQFLEPTL
mgnify:CR=1 FL=1